MKSAFRHKPPRYPEHWEDFPAGKQIQNAITDVCNDYVQRVFGYHFVKLGTLSAQIELPDCPINHVVSQTAKLTEHTSVVGQSHVLPYSENSVDGFLLANELDFAQDPHQILREVDRVITANGYVMISGFNPLSLAGIAKFLPVKRGNVLHDARFFTAHRIKDWLQLLGFEIVEQRHVMFSTLFFQYRWANIERAQAKLSTYFPWCSAVYVILAKKRVVPMTAIRPKLKLKPRFSPVGASIRSAKGSTRNSL